MSWFARSIVNSLKSGDASSEEDEETTASNTDKLKTLKLTPTREEEEENEEEGIAGGESPRGVKEDLSELTKTLTRQFWGVASFLAPPPPPSPTASSPRQSVPDAEDRDADQPALAGIRSDLAEIGGRFKTGISRLSSNMAVTEISKIASSFLPFEPEEEEEPRSEGGAVGVTDEVLAFARNISMHPETWLDFPLFTDDEDSDDFDLSDAQQEHALAVERLAPRLAALRIELCPGHMSEGCFWKIYFVLLHSRLNKRDAELLSTPQIVEARALWLQELQNRTKPESIGTSHIKEPVHYDHDEQHNPSSSISSEKTAPLKTFAYESMHTTHTADIETEKHPVVSTEIKIIDKSVVEEGPKIQTKDIKISDGSSKPLGHKYEEEGDDWLEEDDHTEMGGGTTIPLGNEDDVSFSDLEDDDERSGPASSKTVTDVSDCSTRDSTGWVELRRNPGESTKDGHAAIGSEHPGEETKESSDWQNLDEELDTD